MTMFHNVPIVAALTLGWNHHMNLLEWNIAKEILGLNSNRKAVLIHRSLSGKWPIIFALCWFKVDFTLIGRDEIISPHKIGSWRYSSIHSCLTFSSARATETIGLFSTSFFILTRSWSATFEAVSGFWNSPSWYGVEILSIRSLTTSSTTCLLL